MVSDASGGKQRKSIGDFIRSGDFSDYWSTAISRAGEGEILVRGYPVTELIEHLSYVETVWLLVCGELPTDRQAKLLELVLKSAMDQQFINSAVCAARFTASAFPESAIPAIASGMLATGSVTGSPQECAEMLYGALGDGGRRAVRDTASEVVSRWLEKKGRVPGFGHPIHKRGEPRAETLRRLSIEHGGWGQSGALYDAIGEALGRAKGKPLVRNLAGTIAAVMVDLEWDPLAIGALGAVGYAMALLAHVVEEIRSGVPLRIIPQALGARYIGPEKRHLPEQFVKRSRR